MTSKEKVLKRALEMAIAEYEFRLDCACGVHGGQVDDHAPFARERAKERAVVYIKRAKEELCKKK